MDADCVILGASFDTPADNKKFQTDESFPYALLSDPDKAAGGAYEVVRAPDHKFANLPERASYLIDPSGVIRKTYVVTDTAGHAGEVLADLAALKG